MSAIGTSVVMVVDVVVSLDFLKLSINFSMPLCRSFCVFFVFVCLVGVFFVLF